MKTRLFQLGWAILTLASLWVFGYQLVGALSYFQNLPAKQLNALALVNLSPALFMALNILFICIIYFTFFVIAQLIRLRRTSDSFSLLAAVVLLAFGTGNAGVPTPFSLSFITTASVIFSIPYNAINFLGWTLIAAFAVSYPDGKFVPRWTIAPAVIGFLMSAAWTTNAEAFSTVSGIAALVLVLFTAFGYGSMIYAQVWRYRHIYSTVQKLQVKWFILGIIGVFSTVIPTVLYYPRIIDPATSELDLIHAELFFLATGLAIIILPISIGIAILRYRLWDIDVIIRKTLTYALVAALLAMIYFGVIVLSQQLLATVTNQRSEIVTVISTLAIAALFVPLRNRIQDFIDRRFYRKKYDAQQVLAQYAVTVRDETDLDQLAAGLLQVVQDTMQPKSVSVWLNGQDNASK